MRKPKRLVVALAVTVVLSLAAGTLFNKQLFTSVISAQGVVSLTNKSRTYVGLEKLKYSAALASAATQKAEDMLRRQYFDHKSPDGAMPWDFMEKAGYDYIAAGENLAVGYDSNGGLMKAWFTSKNHKKNILDPEFTEIGVGVARGRFNGTETVIIVQLFGTPAVKSATKRGEFKNMLKADLLNSYGGPFETEQINSFKGIFMGNKTET